MSVIRLGLIGAGLRGNGLATYFMAQPSKYQVIAIHDRVEERARFLAERLGGGLKVHPTLDEMANDPTMDAMVVTTGDWMHVDPVVKSLRGRKHVYLEKPLATTLSDCDAIIEAAQASDKVLYMGFNLRWTPFYEKARQIIASGALGKVHTVECAEYYEGGRSYFRRWNRLREFGGGLWITKATHDFDIMTYLLGIKPVRVRGSANLFHYKPDPQRGSRCSRCDLSDQCPDYWDYTADPKFKEFFGAVAEAHHEPVDLCLYNSDKDTFDHGMAMLEYEGGALGCYTLSVVASQTTRTFVIQGDRGTLRGDLDTNRIEFHERFGGSKVIHDVSALADRSSHGGGDLRILDDFRSCILTGKKPIAGWEDGRLAVRTGLAVRQSCDQDGAWVNLSQVN